MRPFSFLLASAFTTFALAQSPQSFNYQGVARDAVGEPLSGQAIGVEFRLHQGAASGTVVYSETHGATTDQFGLFALHVGEGTPGTTGAFSAIDWSDGPYFLEIGLDLSASGVYTSFGTQQLLSVPYALHAGSSGDLPHGTEVGQIMHWDGGAWVADSGLYVHEKRFGVGVETPDYPLSIQAKGGKMFAVTAEVQPVGSSTKRWGMGIANDGTDSAAFVLDEVTPDSNETRLSIQGTTGHIGIGTQNPVAPLSLVARPVLKQYFQSGDKPTASQFGFTLTDSTGFGIEQGVPDSMTSRLFIESSSGHVGIGNTDPGAPLSIKERNQLYEEFKNGDIPSEQDFVISTGGNTGISFDQDTTGGYASRLSINSSTGHVGIGTNDPPAALSIESRDILKTFFQTGDIPTGDDFAIRTDSTGFDIGQGTPNALTSRLFISKGKGSIGIGTTTPMQKLHIEESTGTGVTGIRILNTASVANAGWQVGHLHDASPELDGSFIFSEPVAFSGAQGISRMVIRTGGNVGINEVIPDVKLHVSRDLADADTPIDLRAGTGIVVIGPMTNNIVLDHQGIQARHTQFQGGGTGLKDTDLKLQPMGGGLTIHGESAMDARKVVIDSLGNVGLGRIVPTEKLDIDGAIRIGDSSNELDGTIRYTGTDFEGRRSGAWTSLTGPPASGPWTYGTLAPDRIYFAPTADPRVGIGTIAPLQKLHVSGANDGGNVSIMVENLESSADGGWLMSAVDDNTVPARMKTFALHEKKGSDLVERITILGDNNVGINETMPYATLHVSRPASDPSSAVALAENTGILCLGQIEDNIVADYRGIQARHGEYIGGGPTLSFTATTLNLQRLGGDILIHGDDAVASHHVTITSEGNLGLGKTAAEKLEIDGAIVVGNTDNVAPSNGTIRWNAASEDLEGFVGTAWTSLTSGGWEKVDNTDAIVVAGAHTKVGIGTAMPDVTLHVSRPASDPDMGTSLDAGSGIACFGDLIDSNLNFEDDGIQARSPAPMGAPHAFTGSTLHLQRRGGGLILHETAGTTSARAEITPDGKLGLGVLAPLERIDIDGAIRIGNSSNEEDGTIRWTGTDFEGRKGGSWNSLTTHTNTDGLWQVASTGGIEYSPPGGGARLSVLPSPSAPVRVQSWAAVVERRVGVHFQNSSTTSSSNPADNRVGLQILNDGTWGGSPASKDIGLYVSQVSGQTEASSNIAAVLNGNVVIGDVTSGQAVGAGGSNVFVITNGGSTPTGPLANGIQMYSAAGSSGTPVLHLMTGDGAVMKLYRQPDMTAADNSTTGPGMDPTTAALIDNMRTRINELEQILKAVGLLTP